MSEREAEEGGMGEAAGAGGGLRVVEVAGRVDGEDERDSLMSASEGLSVRVCLELRLRRSRKRGKGRDARQSLPLPRQRVDLLCRKA